MSVDNQIIQGLLNKNKVSDLNRFLKSTRCLNNTNVALMYLFHIVQSAGILTTTIAAGFDSKEIVWVGAGLNALAAMIHIFEKLNTSLIVQYNKEIEEIRTNTYNEEDALKVDDDDDNANVIGKSGAKVPTTSVVVGKLPTP